VSAGGDRARTLLAVPWDDALTSYDFGPGHPLAPVRVELTMALARGLGVFDAPGVALAPVARAGDDVLEYVHAPEYIAAVKGADAGLPDAQYFGLGTGDNPVFPGMHEASALIAGASVAAAQAVWSGAAGHAANIAGGLHHAMRARASGFCVYNDAAISIARLLRLGAERVVYVDVDAHHGDGVQAAFYDDPRVLTISLHQDPRTLFPGTGTPQESGGPDAAGGSVNVPLPPGTRDAQWLRAFDAVVPPLVRAFAPQVLVSQHGCDSHRLDPLTGLALSVDGQRGAAERVHRLAHEHAGGRWVLLGGGGYALVEVVPRTWTHLLAEAAHRPIPPQTATPQDWRDEVARRTGRRAPETMTDAGGPGAAAPLPAAARSWNESDPVDRSILATRRAVFPHHGLDPAAPPGFTP
jgi:acetoin utilization protein AcuC